MRTKIPSVPEVFFSRAAGCFGVRQRPTDLRQSRVAPTKKLFAEVTIKTSRKRPETGCQKSLAPRVEHKVIFPKNPIESDNRELMT